MKKPTTSKSSSLFYLRIFGIILIFFFLSISVNGQSKNDTLWINFNDISITDSVRFASADRYIKNRLLRTNPDSALIIAKVMLDSAGTRDNRLYEGITYQLIGEIYDVKSKFIEALEAFEKSDSIYSRIKNKRKSAELSRLQVNVYRKLGMYNRAINIAKSSLVYHELIKDTLGMAWDHWSLSLIYQEALDYTNAAIYQQKSLEEFEALNYLEGIARVLNGIAYRIAINENGKEGEVDTKSIEYAEECLKRSLEIHRQLGNRQYESYNLNNLGLIYRLQGKTEEAIEFFQKSLKLKSELSDTWAAVDTKLRIGQFELSRNNYRKAYLLCRECNKLMEGVEGLSWKKDINKCLYESLKNLGRYREAVKYNDLYLIYSDSLLKTDISKRLQQLEFKNKITRDSLEQEAEKIKLQLEYDRQIQNRNRQKNIFLVSSLFILLIAGGLWSRLRFIRRAKGAIEREKEKSENLLLNILPYEVAEELKLHGASVAKDINNATILFTDFKEFTKLSEQLRAKELVHEINVCFKAFDEICTRYEVEKIKTIGDAYMAAGGLPLPYEGSTKNTVLAALEMAQFILDRKEKQFKAGKAFFEMRVGINTGPVVAGVVGLKKFQYDIWGDTVNLASRMESKGEVGKVNISESTYNLIKNDPDFSFEERGNIDVKGKGEVLMYFVDLAK